MNYLGYEVFPFWATTKKFPEQDAQGNYIKIGNSFSKQKVIKYSKKNNFIEVTLFTDNKQYRKEIENYFDSKKGALTPFWLPSFKRDFVIHTPSANLTELIIERAGYADYFDEISKMHIIFRSGYEHATNIISAVNIDEETEKITIGSAPNTFLGSEIFINFLFFVRFENDSLSFNYQENDIATCTIKFKELRDEI